MGKIRELKRYKKNLTLNKVQTKEALETQTGTQRTQKTGLRCMTNQNRGTDKGKTGT